MLDDGLVFRGGVGELAAFPDVVGNGFLDVGVLTIRGGGGSDEGVGVVRRGDDDGVDVLRLADLAEIGEFRDLGAFLVEFGGEGVEHGGVGIAESDELCALALHDIPGEAFATAVEAYHTDAEIAVGRGGAGEGGGEGEGSGEVGCGEETAAVHGVFWLGDFEGFR